MMMQLKNLSYHIFFLILFCINLGLGTYSVVLIMKYVITNIELDRKKEVIKNIIHDDHCIVEEDEKLVILSSCISKISNEESKWGNPYYLNERSKVDIWGNPYYLIVEKFNKQKLIKICSTRGKDKIENTFCKDIIE